MVQTFGLGQRLGCKGWVGVRVTLSRCLAQRLPGWSPFTFSTSWLGLVLVLGIGLGLGLGLGLGIGSWVGLGLEQQPVSPARAARRRATGRERHRFR